MKRLTLACVMMLFVASVSATTVLYKNLNELVTEAEGIVIGTVRNVESRYGPDHEIYTFVTLDQLNLIKGTYKQEKLTIRLQGGKVKNDILEVEGSPQFTPGEKVILFLHGNGHEIVPLVGWTQGVFRIVPNATGNEDVLDYEGNRIFSIRGVELLKEHKFLPKMRVLGDEVSSSVRSVEATGSPGQSDQGEAADLSDQQTNSAVTTQQAMSVSAFVNALKERIAATSKDTNAVEATRELNSIYDFETGTAQGQNQDATPPAQRGESADKPAIPQADSTVPFLPAPSPLKGQSGRDGDQ